MSHTSRNTTRNTKTTLLAAAIAGVMLAAAPAWSQTASTPSTAMKDTASSDKIARSDASMMKDLAQGNMGEIDAGKLALEKSQNADVKKFAQMMVDDHTKALGEVTALAQTKGVVLPDGAGAMAKTKATAMKALSGSLFDKEYAKHAGVGDHEKTVKLLKKIEKDGKDADFKALATKMLPTVEGHLKMAKDLAAMKMDKAS